MGGSLAVLQDGSAILFYADNDGVKKRTIDPKGKLSPNDSHAFSAPLDAEILHDPNVAFSTTAKGTTGLLFATSYKNNFRGNGTAWAQVLDSKGFPIGKPVVVNPISPDTWTKNGSLLMALPRNVSQTSYEFVWLQTLGEIKGSILKLNLDVQP